jgi:hypothetical protein
LSPFISGKKVSTGAPLQAAFSSHSRRMNITVPLALIMLTLQGGHASKISVAVMTGMYFCFHHELETVCQYRAVITIFFGFLIYCFAFTTFTVKQFSVSAFAGCFVTPISIHFLAPLRTFFVGLYLFASWHKQSQSTTWLGVQVVSALVTVPQWSQAIFG